MVAKVFYIIYASTWLGQFLQPASALHLQKPKSKPKQSLQATRSPKGDSRQEKRRVERDLAKSEGVHQQLQVERSLPGHDVAIKFASFWFVGILAVVFLAWHSQNASQNALEAILELSNNPTPLVHAVDKLVQIVINMCVGVFGFVLFQPPDRREYILKNRSKVLAVVLLVSVVIWSLTMATENNKPKIH